jgi:membrane-associated phospholipid phosphatase
MRGVMKATVAISLLILGPGASIARGGTGETLGDIGEIAIPASGFAVAALHKDKKGLLQAAESLAATLVVVRVLKPIVDRERPNGGHQGFPSGHTAAAFAGAAFLQRRYGWAYGAPAYAGAAFVGESRVHAHQHYTTDVLAGAALGIASNFVFTHKREKVAVQTFLGEREGEVRIAVRW